MIDKLNNFVPEIKNQSFKIIYSMSTKSIICLANSYKNGGRCLAGIEVRKSLNGYNVITNNDGSPKWVRPVMRNDKQGIPENMVGTFGIFDILDIEVIEEVPSGAHSENVLFRSIIKVGHYNGNLEVLCDESHALIFGNRGKAVPSENFCDVDYSLMFLKPESLFIETQSDDFGHEKYRMKFSYRGNRYDFPLTDPKYISMLQNGICEDGERYNEIYLTISLGVNYNDWHYKLVAGVIDMAA